MTEAYLIQTNNSGRVYTISLDLYTNDNDVIVSKIDTGATSTCISLPAIRAVYGTDSLWERIKIIGK